METITRNVKDIGSEDRRALEHVLGQPLAEHQQIVIHVVSPNLPLPESYVSEIPAEQEVPAWWNVYEGLSDEEIAEIEKIALTRANLTRTFD